MCSSDLKIMFFKRLEIHGFKSFADPVTIDFNQGITCVVGPNGSGKNNIYGERRYLSQASLRRLTDILQADNNAGAGNRPALPGPMLTCSGMLQFSPITAVG